MSAKQAINDKLQGSVATYLRFGGVVNKQIKKGLMLSPRMKKKLKSMNIWKSYKKERGDWKRKYGKRKYESAAVENVSTAT